jgi:DNA polymerase I-like protein with 3'-5' exonuclease and polymerase domains
VIDLGGHQFPHHGGGGLSRDPDMQRAYLSADPYLTFARLAGAVPNSATKDTHPLERRLYKTTILGVQYGIGVVGLAYRLGVSLTEAETLLEHHRKVFRTFWAWLDAACDWGQLSGKLQCSFGWTFHVGGNTSMRTIRNYPVQGNGAEMLRLACIFVVEAGITLNAPVHDALLIEADDARIEEAVATTQTAMRKASEAVLQGFALRSDAQIIRNPDRFQDERGAPCGIG